MAIIIAQDYLGALASVGVAAVSLQGHLKVGNLQRSIPSSVRATLF